ncbi:hypothetical protein PAHAL_3G049300 [Panicum hallii]|uniref:Uncharacterized protein n=1 Tax=Panicum hallii TaxID=206008 RepID=A0A2T8KH50_9POAL|nr:hypothetical protein PAHAL_3G049300 [Panicum hallii]
MEGSVHIEKRPENFSFREILPHHASLQKSVALPSPTTMSLPFQIEIFCFEEVIPYR